ncbi:MAG: class I lanthipeptide [Saprospiraceae bacterium]
MANQKKLSLDKERLVRLQNQQLSGIIGGADGEVNITTNTDATVERLTNAEAASVPGGSCCKKSCS